MRVPDLTWPADLFADAIVSFPDADMIPDTATAAMAHSFQTSVRQWNVSGVRSETRRSTPSRPARIGRGLQGSAWRGPNPILRIVSQAEDLSVAGAMNHPASQPVR